MTDKKTETIEALDEELDKALLDTIKNGVTALDDDGKIVGGYVPEGINNWGRWGDDDQIGTQNLIGPEQRIRAAGLIQSGRVFSLARWPRRLFPERISMRSQKRHMIWLKTGRAQRYPRLWKPPRCFAIKVLNMPKLWRCSMKKSHRSRRWGMT